MPSAFRAHVPVPQLEFLECHRGELGWELSPNNRLLEKGDDVLSPHALQVYSVHGADLQALFTRSHSNSAGGKNSSHQTQYDVCRFKLCNNVSLPFLAAPM